MFSTNHAEGHAQVEAVMREVHVLRQLNHPSIVQLCDVVEMVSPPCRSNKKWQGCGAILRHSHSGPFHPKAASTFLNPSANGSIEDPFSPILHPPTFQQPLSPCLTPFAPALLRPVPYSWKEFSGPDLLSFMRSHPSGALSEACARSLFQ
jgi:hypothetical protein